MFIKIKLTKSKLITNPDAGINRTHINIYIIVCERRLVITDAILSQEMNVTIVESNHVYKDKFMFQ